MLSDDVSAILAVELYNVAFDFGPVTVRPLVDFF